MVSFPVQYDAAQRLQKAAVTGRREYLCPNDAPLPESRTPRGASDPQYSTLASPSLESRGLSVSRPSVGGRTGQSLNGRGGRGSGPRPIMPATPGRLPDSRQALRPSPPLPPQQTTYDT